MKKKILSFFMFCSLLTANAQIPNGSIAPDFTFTDINGVSHNLYTYLNAGKTVYFDFSATWCTACWYYHNSHAFEQLWEAHGPAGEPGVSANTTDDVIVFLIEGDETTTSADLHGNTSSSMGDWVSGVNYPIIDPSGSEIAALDQLIAEYGISYFPTLFMICPSKSVYQVNPQTAAGLYATKAEYGCFAATGTNNPALLGYTGETAVCSATDVTVKLHNLGTSPLTTATIQLKEGSTVLNTVNWTGNLPSYGVQEVNVGSVNPAIPTTYTIVITSADDDASNNTLSQLINTAPVSSTSNVTVNIVTDKYGSETTWRLENSSGTTVASGGPYTDMFISGEYPQPAVNATLVNGECYTIRVMDSNHNGMDYGTGQGSFTVKDGNNNILATGGNFTDETFRRFRGSGTAGIEEEVIASMNVFPNPASSMIHVVFEAENKDYSVSVLDLQGRVVLTDQYSNLTGSQSIEIPVLGLKAGNYFVRVASGGGTTQRMVTIN